MWERICGVTRWRKLGDLADFLAIKSPSVSGAKSRGIFPIEWAFKIGQEFGLSTDWILTGKGYGGPQPSIDEDLFIRVVFAIESLLKQRCLDLSLWQKLRLYIYIYEESIMSTGTIDPEMINKVISLVATNAAVVDKDGRIIELVAHLVAEAPTDNERLKSADNWLRKISEKFQGHGLLASLIDKGRVIAWLEAEIDRQKAKTQKA